jgi:hypothetical protein
VIDINTERWEPFTEQERALVAYGLTHAAVKVVAPEALHGNGGDFAGAKHKLETLYAVSLMVQEISETLGVGDTIRFAGTLARLSELIEETEDD